MMPSPAVVSELQVPRSLTPAAALCRKSLADPLQEENWQDAQRETAAEKGTNERKIWKKDGGEESFSLIRFSDCGDTQTGLQTSTHSTQQR